MAQATRGIPADDDAYLAALLAQDPDEPVPGIPPLPSFDIQRRFNGGADTAENLRSGFSFYLDIKREAVAAGRPLGPASRILDFGCGWGRIARIFLRDVDEARIHGIDIDPVGIEACRTAMPQATFQLVNARGPAPFANSSLDLVYACSVFSHLPEDLHLKWLSEIRRILVPGGVLVATTLPVTMVDHAASLRAKADFRAPWQRAVAESFPEDARSTIDEGGFVFGPYPRADYGQAIITPAYVERIWSRSFEIQGFKNGRFAQPIIVGVRR